MTLKRRGPALADARADKNNAIRSVGVLAAFHGAQLVPIANVERASRYRGIVERQTERRCDVDCDKAGRQEASRNIRNRRAMPAPCGDHDRLAKMVASPVAGERQGALKAVNRHIRELWPSWERTNEPPGNGDDRSAHLVIAGELMRTIRCVLTSWETKFLISVETLPALSPKQRVQLAALRCTAEAAGRPGAGYEWL